MFGRSEAFSSFSVDDLGRARAFYADLLGLDVREEHGMLDMRLPGGGRVLVYPKADHVPAVFTVLNFAVDDLGSAVDGLGAAGVTMERYPGFAQDERGICRTPGGPAIAWFTDPAGNVISVLEEPGGTGSG